MFIMNQKVKNAGDIFFYIGMILITFNQFPFSKFGLGSEKSLSIIPLIFYLLISFLSRKTVFAMRTDKMEFKIIVLILALSFIIGFVRYNDISGFMQSISMWSIYIISLLSFRTYVHNASREKIVKMLKLIYTSFTISLFFAFIEFIYFYISKVGIIYNLLSFILRDGIYLKAERLQFNFGEAGDSGIMIIGLLLPTLLLLKQYGYNFRLSDKIKIGLIFFFSFFSFSNSFFLDILLLIILILIYLGRAARYRRYFIPLVFLVAICASFLVNSVLFQNSRFGKLVNNFDQTSQNETSTSTRFGLWQVSYESMKDYPILGYGWGYFKYAFNRNYMKADVPPFNNEFYNKYNQDALQTYSLYSTALVEGGLVGLVWLCLFLFFRYKKTPTKMKPYFWLFVFNIIQFIPIYSVSYLFGIFLISDEKVTKIKQTNDKECLSYK